jgi:hypothetical protein
MALRRFTLAIDNHPAFGFATIEEISRSGEFQLETGWTPQAAIVSLAQQFNLPPEFIPTSGAMLYRLDQASPGGKVYDIYDNIGITGGTAATISIFEHVGVVSPVIEEMVTPRAWYLDTSVTGEADQVTLTVDELSGETDLYAISHGDDEVEGELLFFGVGTDVSVAHDLPAGTMWETATSIPADANIAEMVFVDGIQVEGDIYYGAYGAYDMTVVEGTVYISFVTPIDTGVQSLMFGIFDRLGEPIIHVRETNPFEIQIDEEENEHRGVMVTFENFPKGDTILSYYIV